MKQLVIVLCVALPLAGCAGLFKPKLVSAPRPAPPQTALQSLTAGGQSAAALDSVSDAQKAAAVAAPNAGAVLGTVTVGLGSPAEAGLWLKSDLVSAPAKGRAVLANGNGVNVDLLPTTQGATLSFSAYRALGLGLTELPQVQVLRLP